MPSFKRQAAPTIGTNPYLSLGYQPATATDDNTYTAHGQFRAAISLEVDKTGENRLTRGWESSETGQDRLERERLAEEERLENQRKIERKAELRKDPNVLYRNYHEYIEYFPLEAGQYKDPYLVGLLANRYMPLDLDSELGLAVTYAKKNWDIYMEYPRDVERAAQYQRKTPEYQRKLAQEQARKDWKPVNKR